MISSIISRLVILVFGTLYPAYASYKAVRTKNVKEYVKWMMYWIVFALFTCAETFTDVFCSFWFPFYYEFKVILVLWLLSPATKGSSILYRKFVHPMLTKREQEIDEYIAKAKEQGYHTVLTLGTKGVNYATTVIMQTAIKSGGGIVNQLRRSYSLSDISADMDAIAELNRSKVHPEDELDIGDAPLPIDPRLRRSRGYSPRRSTSGSGRVEMYFPEVDVNVRQRGSRPRETGIPLSHIRSNEDVSSGYSSAELLYSGHPVPTDAQEPLVRTSSVGSSRVTRTKTVRGGVIAKRPTPPAEDNESWIESEESDSGDQEEHFYEAPSAVPSEPVAIVPIATFSQSASPQPTIRDLKSNVIVVARKLSIEEEAEPETAPNIISTVLGNEKKTTEKQMFEVLKTRIPQKERDLDSRQNPDTFLESPLIEENSRKEGISDWIVNTLSSPYNDLPSTAINDGVFGEESISPQTEELNNDKVFNAPELVIAKFCEESIVSQIEEPNSNGEVLISPDSVIAAVVDEKLEKIPGTSSEKKHQDQDDAEFFDSENVIIEESSILSFGNGKGTQDLKLTCADVLVDQVSPDDKQGEHEIVQKALDESGKDSRAGRYHKLPAPCPPQRLNNELSKPGTNEEGLQVDVTSSKPEYLSPSHNSPSPRGVSPLPKSTEASPNIPKRKIKAQGSGENLQKSSERESSLVQSNDYKHDVSHSPVSFVGNPDVHALAQPKSEPSSSPNQPRTDLKSKHDTPFISRLLSKPKSQLTSFFPFFSSREDIPHIAGLLSSSLTSLDDDFAQGRMRSSSTVSAMSTSSNMSKHPELPPRKKTPEIGNIHKDIADKDLLTKASVDTHKSRSDTPRESGAQIQIRDMSHSPPRRHT